MRCLKRSVGLSQMSENADNLGIRKTKTFLYLFYSFCSSILHQQVYLLIILPDTFPVETKDVFFPFTRSYNISSSPAANITFESLAATAMCVMFDVQARKHVVFGRTPVATRMSKVQRLFPLDNIIPRPCAEWEARQIHIA